MSHPNFVKYKELYSINDLSFKTKTDIIESQFIQRIVPPFQSFLDPRNKRGLQNYERYLIGGNYISNPQICLDSALGLINKGEDEVKLPKNLEDIIFYATKEGTPLTSIKNNTLSNIFKFGSCLLKVTIPEEVSVADSIPKLEVIAGKDVIDYGTYLDDTGTQQFNFIVIDTSRPIFNSKTKYYTQTKLYKILSINSDDVYYEAEIPQNLYTQFDFEHPLLLKDKMISYIEPAWGDTLNFIPVVGVNKLDCTFAYTQAFIQDLIETSLANFRLTCNLSWLESNCAASHLVIKGKNLDDVDSYPIGAGALHVLNDESASEQYVTPSTNGMSEIKEHIKENNLLIEAMQFNLLNAGANSAAEALQFRIAVKVSDLVALVKNIGHGLTRILELIDLIVNDGKNKDLIEYIPFIDFDKVNTYIGDSSKENKVED